MLERLSCRSPESLFACRKHGCLLNRKAAHTDILWRDSSVALLLTAEQRGGCRPRISTGLQADSPVRFLSFFITTRGPTRNPGSWYSSGELALTVRLPGQIELGKKGSLAGWPATMSSVPQACNLLPDCAPPRLSKYMAQSGKLQKTRARKTVVIICLRRQIQSLIRGDSEDFRYLDCQPAVSM